MHERESSAKLKMREQEVIDAVIRMFATQGIR